MIATSTPPAGSSSATWIREPSHCAEAVLEARLEEVRPACAAGRRSTRGDLSTPWTTNALAGQRDREGQADVAQPDDADRRSLQQPLGDVAVGLREVGVAADVEPVLADGNADHRAPGPLEERDQLGASNGRSRGISDSTDGLDDVDAGC